LFGRRTVPVREADREIHSIHPLEVCVAVAEPTAVRTRYRCRGLMQHDDFVTDIPEIR
jgi:hypothetical protein